MDERSSVSLICLVKGEGELKARGMEVGKDLSRKEKIAQAKALLEEGEWKELGEGRKMRRNMSKKNLIIKALPQVTTKSALVPLLEKMYSLNWASASCNKGISTEVIQNAVTQLENEGNYVTPEEFIKALANVLAQKPDIRKDRRLRTFTGIGESLKPRKSGKLELTYTVTGEPKPFDKQTQLDTLKHMKSEAEAIGMPFTLQSEIDKLEAEKKAWDAKYNGQLKLDKAKSSNIVDVYTKIGNLIDNAKKAEAKVSELTPTLDMASEDVIEPLKGGIQVDKDNAKKYEYALNVYRKYVQACKELEKAIDALENPLIIDAGEDPDIDNAEIVK